MHSTFTAGRPPAQFGGANNGFEPSWTQSPYASETRHLRTTGVKCNDSADFRPAPAPRIHRITSARSSPTCHDGIAPPRGFEASDRSSLRSSRPDTSRWPSDRSSLRSSRPDSQRRPAPASSPLHHCIYRRALCETGSSSHNEQGPASTGHMSAHLPLSQGRARQAAGTARWVEAVNHQPTFLRSGRARLVGASGLRRPATWTTCATPNPCRSSYTLLPRTTSISQSAHRTPQPIRSPNPVMVCKQPAQGGRASKLDVATLNDGELPCCFARSLVQ